MPPASILKVGSRATISLNAQQTDKVFIGAIVGVDGGTWATEGPSRETYSAQSLPCPPNTQASCRHSDTWTAELKGAGNSFHIYVACNWGGTQMVAAWKYTKMKAADVPAGGRR